MELQKLQYELDQYKNTLEQVNAEKTSLDQMFVESLKNYLNVKKELILLQGSYQKLLSELNLSKEESSKLDRELKKEVA